MTILPPINIDDEKVVVLPVKTRVPRDEEAFLQPVPHSACQHWDGPFEVDEDAGKCKCLACGGEVTPIFVLMQLMRKESRWMQTRAAYNDEMKRLWERSRTKCQHCGKTTRISKA